MNVLSKSIYFTQKPYKQQALDNLQFYILPEDTTYIKHAQDTGKLNSDVSVLCYDVSIVWCKLEMARADFFATQTAHGPEHLPQ